MPAGHRPCSRHLDAPWPAVVAVSGTASGCYAARVAMSTGATAGTAACPRWWPADGRRPDIRPEHQTAADTSMAIDISPGYVCRTPAVRTAVVPEPADGQSADRSGSLQFPLLFLKAGPAGGRRSPSGPALTRRSLGSRPHPPPRWYEPTLDQPHDLRSWGETEGPRSSRPSPTRCLAASDTGSPHAGHRTRARRSDDDGDATVAQPQP
jgi:hypothetical protein